MLKFIAKTITIVLMLVLHISYCCKISEFSCRGGVICLPLDKYCDGKDDCGDKSDEPAYCTGVVGANSESGACIKCTVEGVWDKGGRHISYPFFNCRLRTNESFRNGIDEDHHKETTPLVKLPMEVDLIKSFVISDSLHLFDLVCNRTYYGDIGRTYSLRVPPPQWNRLPFLCHLTFTASGNEQGDIVQIIFDGFNVGRFDEGLIDTDSEVESSLSPVGELPGCPEGFMQLSELGRPFTGGSWCGSATGHQLYYSETSTVTASVKVFHAPLGAATPFEFRIRYKFISQSDAIVRFTKLFRLSKDAVKYLMSEIDDYLPTRARSTTTPNILKLAATLRFCGQGSYQQSVGQDFLVGLSQSSVSVALNEVLSVIEEKVCPKWVSFRQSNQTKQEAAIHFYSKTGFPGVIGCVDGTDINIIRPVEDEHLYFNRKANHSLNTMIACDHNTRIMSVDARYGGSSHDSLVWSLSSYRQYLQQLRRNNGNSNYWLLGDSGYPLEPWLLTPYRSTSEGSREARYNEIHSKTRNVVERTIGILKGRFRCLLGARELHYEPKKACQIVNDCAALHNRYGSSNELLELGRVTPGTYCTRQFDECYRKNCRLQSPNYPGMYPRNVTCYWTIRQKNVPTCKHAMVAVSQENEHKALVKRSIASLNKTSRSIRAWSDCTGERDHLIFYDGSSTNDPVLAKYCGGDWLPKVVSRGPEMLIAFHSSPFSAPLESGIPYRGFELDVDILFSDSDSYDFAQQNKGCEFHINATNPDDVLMSRRGRMGKILSPRHTLPPNTTCTYYFHGHSTDLIWIYFTSYNLQILQPPFADNTSLGRADIPPWITRFRIWDSNGTISYNNNVNSNNVRVTTPSSFIKNSTMQNTNYYYYSSQNVNYPPKNMKINVDNVWNPVDAYIYGPTSNTIFDQNNKYVGIQTSTTSIGAGAGSATSPSSSTSSQKYDKFGNVIGVKDTFNYIANTKYQNPFSIEKDPNEQQPSNAMDLSQIRTIQSMKAQKKIFPESKMGSRKLIVELYDNETPKLCDHTALQTNDHKLRPCSPLESYVSSGNDLKIEFHSHTGTALYPASFTMNYEFVDTDLGGEIWTGRKGEEPVPTLCSRVFRKRRGDFHSPRDVFLHGRGGAKNITCLYRFEANIGERIRFVLHNVSFGESATCTTDSDYHTGRPKCLPVDNDPETRISELRIYDIPYRDVKIQLGCFCDNTSSIYNAPLTFQSNSKTMEITFTVTKLNVSEDFADIYFHASYEFMRVPDCRKKLRLRGSGGEDDIEYPLKSQDSTCEGQPWYIETQTNDRSIFVLTWGSFLPAEPSSEDALRCNTRNRLIIYSGRPLKVMRVICPSVPGQRQTALHIFSEDWTAQQPTLFNTKPTSMLLEPVLREIGSIGFSWLEIQRTKSSLIQQLDMQTNYTANETLGEFGLFPKTKECEHKCPELDACISSVLWCDGRPNCPSGYDESEEECGTARRLLELPGGIFAALGCIAAAIAACILFCLFGLIRKRKKSFHTKSSSVLNGTLKNEIKKDPLFMEPGS